MKTVVSDQWPVVSEEKRLSPAMERWRERLAAGYTIRPRLRVGERGYVVWGPGLFNPDGAFVQNVRRDVMRKLMRLGILGEDGRGRVDELDGVDAVAGMDEDNEPSAAAGEPAGSGGVARDIVGRDSE